jgi:hypothetical protein
MVNLKFEKIQEGRSDYYCEYSAPSLNANFAILNITFPNESNIANAKSICETEIEHWVRKYGVPILLFAWNSSEDQISLQENSNSNPLENKLIGWLDNSDGSFKKSYRRDEQDRALKLYTAPTDWREVYKGINYIELDTSKTAANARAIDLLKKIRFQKIVLVVWLAVIPACWAIIQYCDPLWLGIAVTIYAVYRSILDGLKTWGYIKPTMAEREKSRIYAQKEHHHYHCIQNPDGFLRLKLENFKREAENETVRTANLLGTKTDKKT